MSREMTASIRQDARKDNWKMSRKTLLYRALPATIRDQLVRGGRLQRRLSPGVILTLAWSMAAWASADVITASGAGPLPGSAQNLTGLYPTEITGSLDGTDPYSADMFEIDILSPTIFSAYTVLPGAFGVDDPALFLFDASGNGVYMNDDEDPSNASDTQACLPASGQNPCPQGLPPGDGPLSPGDYYLAISYSANYPIDAGSNEIFGPVNFTDVVGPNGGVGPVAGWDGGSFASPDTDLVNYEIFLNGAVPEPATWVLTATAGLALFLIRRRRK